MEVIHARCCGIDVHQASLAVCVTIKEGGKSDKHKLRCGTTTAELLRLSDWLHGYQVTHVAMEATGVYWKPVWHVSEGQFELLLANPTQVQALRGRKTDLKDGERIVDFLQHGLLQGSFVPPQPIQQMGDLTRSRTTLKQEQVRIGNRIRKVLEDANLKLSSVMSDVMGVSGLLRRWLFLDRNQFIAELFGLAFDLGLKPALAFCIPLCPNALVVFDFVFHHRIKDHGDIMRRSCRGGFWPELEFHSPQIISHGGKTVMQAISGHAKHLSGPVLYLACPLPEHTAPTDIVVGA